MSSSRARQSQHERLEWENRFQAEKRTAEDHEQYDKYAAQMRAESLEPLPFEEWRKFAPADESNPVLRGAIATCAFGRAA